MQNKDHNSYATVYARFLSENKNVDGLCIYLFIYSLNSATCREKEHTMSELSINFNSMKQQLWAHYIKILVHIPFKKAALIVWAKKCMVHWIEPNTLFRHTVWGVWANMKIDCLHTFFTWSRSKGERNCWIVYKVDWLACFGRHASSIHKYCNTYNIHSIVYCCSF